MENVWPRVPAQPAEHVRFPCADAEVSRPADGSREPGASSGTTRDRKMQCAFRKYDGSMWQHTWQGPQVGAGDRRGSADGRAWPVVCVQERCQCERPTSATRCVSLSSVTAYSWLSALCSLLIFLCLSFFLCKFGIIRSTHLIISWSELKELVHIQPLEYCPGM